MGPNKRLWLSLLLLVAAVAALVGGWPATWAPGLAGLLGLASVFLAPA